MSDADAAADDSPDDEVRLDGPDSRFDALLLWLSENTVTVVAVGGLTAFVLAAILGVSFPRWIRVGGLSAVVSLLVVGRPTATRVRSMFHSPEWVYIVDVDVEHGDPEQDGLFRVPDERFVEHWECTEGSVDRYGNLVVARDVDFDAATFKATWRATLDDFELLNHLGAVRDVRNRLEPKAKVGQRFDNNAWGIVYRAVEETTRVMRDTFEEGTLPDEGDGIDAAINDVLADFGLDRDEYLLDHLDDSDDPTEDLPDDHGLNDAAAVLHGGSLADLAGADQTEDSGDD